MNDTKKEQFVILSEQDYFSFRGKYVRVYAWAQARAELYYPVPGDYVMVGYSTWEHVEWVADERHGVFEEEDVMLRFPKMNERWRVMVGERTGYVGRIIALPTEQEKRYTLEGEWHVSLPDIAYLGEEYE